MTDHIVIGDIRPRIQYTADGTQAVFTYPFPIFAAADLKVYLGEALQSAGFAVNGAGQSAGGNVTFTAPPAAGTRVTLVRALAIARTSDFQEGGAFRAKTLNDELDRQTAFIQEVGERIERAIVAAPTESAAPLVLPPPAQRANALLGFDAAGAPIASAGGVAVPIALAPLVQAPTLTAARQVLGALGNERLAKTAAHTVANADKGKTIACANGPWTLTFNAAAGYDADFAVCVVNESAARGIKVALSGGTDFWLYPSQTALVFRQDASWRVLRPERWRLAAALTIHVDGANGNNANDGLAAGAGNALATFAAARDLACQNLDFAGQTVTIQLANGIYASPLLFDQNHDWLGAGVLRVLGDAVTPSNVTISTANLAAIDITGAKSGRLLFRGLKVSTIGAGHGINASYGAVLGVETDFEFSTCAYAHCSAQFGGVIQFEGNYRISGGASIHFEADFKSAINALGKTVSIIGTPGFAVAFARAIQLSLVSCQSMTFVGSATGARYSALSNGVIETGGGGASYLPGSTAGSVANGGQYV